MGVKKIMTEVGVEYTCDILNKVIPEGKEFVLTEAIGNGTVFVLSKEAAQALPEDVVNHGPVLRAVLNDCSGTEPTLDPAELRKGVWMVFANHMTRSAINAATWKDRVIAPAKPLATVGEAILLLQSMAGRRFKDVYVLENGRIVMFVERKTVLVTTPWSLVPKETPK